MKECIINVVNYINSLSLMDILLFCVLLICSILMVVLINLLKGYTLVKDKNDDKVLNKLESNNTNEELDLSIVTQQLENAEKKNITLTPYEEEQEEKAIISYDELLKSRNDLAINYEEEQEEDGIVVKKVDMENMTVLKEEKTDLEESKSTVRVISYEKEEAFLQSLKKLQELLNS